MKAIILKLEIILLLMVITVLGFSQSNNSWYYDKLFNKTFSFTESNKQLISVFKPEEDKNISEEEINQLKIEKRYKVKIKNNIDVYNILNGADISTILKIINNIPNIDTAYPALVDQEGFTRYYVQNRLTVQFYKNVSEKEILKIISKEGCEIVTNHWTPGYYTLKTGKGKDLFKTIRRLYEYKEVVFANLDFYEFNSATYIPNDALISDQWGLHNTGQFSGTPGADINIYEAWDIETGDPNVLICILDEGFDYNHEDLVENAVQGYDFADNDNDPVYDPNTSSYRHGTACAGIAVAKMNNLVGIAGVAGGCSWMPLKINLTSGYNSQRADAINYAASFINDYDGVVLSCSWHATGDLTDIHYAIINAKNAGAVLCFASGNDNQTSIVYPARYPECIAVGATSMCDTRKRTGSSQQQESCCNGHVYKRPDPLGFSCDSTVWWGSSFGVGLDVAAPGTFITTTDIEGDEGYNPDPDGYNYLDCAARFINNYNNRNYTYWFSGTSAATPFVAGLAALLLSNNHSLNPDNVQSIIQFTADKTGGYTYVNGWSEDLGYGRINAGCALQNSYRRIENETLSGTQTYSDKVVVEFKNTVISSSADITVEAANINIDRGFEIQLGGKFEISTKTNFTCP